MIVKQHVADWPRPPHIPFYTHTHTRTRPPPPWCLLPCLPPPTSRTLLHTLAIESSSKTTPFSLPFTLPYVYSICPTHYLQLPCVRCSFAAYCRRSTTPLRPLQSQSVRGLASPFCITPRHRMRSGGGGCGAVRRGAFHRAFIWCKLLRSSSECRSTLEL